MVLNIDPPLLNSASPWATTFEDIKELYNCPYTGAVTTRTSLLEGFSHDDAVHQHCFFEPGKNAMGKGDSSAWNGRYVFGPILIEKSKAGCKFLLCSLVC